MERESNPNMQALCRSGCGFYGSPATDGLCSLCYKENLKKKQQLPSSTPASLSALRDTATGQTTISHISTSQVNDLPSETVEEASSAGETATSCSPSASATNNGGASPVAASPSNHSNNSVIVTTTNNQEGNNSSGGGGAPSASSLGATGTTTTTTSDGGVATTADDLIPAPPGTPPELFDISSSSSNSDDKDGDKDAKKKKNRCATCRKKVGLTGFECRCGGLFCAVHRYSDKHDCSFNYREMGAQEIRRNNPVVVGEKIQKI